MAYVKLDTGILDSTLWIERECREVFITALLMAAPREFTNPVKQIAVRTLDETGFIAPPGWYGFVEAAGVGILRRAMVEQKAGMTALEKLGGPDDESRSEKHEGRRLIRVDGGYVVLNFIEYRDRDHTAGLRAQRYRDRKKRLAEEGGQPGPSSPPSRRDVDASRRNVTQAEAEAEAEAKRKEKKTKAPAAPLPLTGLESVPRNVMDDWLKARKDKRASTLTQTAVNGLIRQAKKAGIAVEEAVRMAAESSWITFKADYMRSPANAALSAMPATAKAAHAASWHKGIFGDKPTPPQEELPLVERTTDA